MHEMVIVYVLMHSLRKSFLPLRPKLGLPRRHLHWARELHLAFLGHPLRWRLAGRVLPLRQRNGSLQPPRLKKASLCCRKRLVKLKIKYFFAKSLEVTHYRLSNFCSLLEIIAKKEGGNSTHFIYGYMVSDIW